MIYLFTLFMVCTGYYSITFGVSLWRKKNKVGGVAAIAIAVVGTIVPAVVMFIKR